MGKKGLDLGELAGVMAQDIAVGRASPDETIQDWIGRNADWLRSIGYEVDDKGMTLAAPATEKDGGGDHALEENRREAREVEDHQERKQAARENP